MSDTDKPIWSCGVNNHPDSLIYFDKLYGAQCSWEVCQVCGETHSMTELSVPNDDAQDTTHGYYDSRGYHYYSGGDDQ